MAAACAAVAALGLVVACGDDDDSAGASSDTTAAPVSDTTVGLVSDVGKFNDRSFNQSALEGLERAEAELGVDGSPIESKSASDYIPNLTSLARDDTSVIIGVGFLMADALDTVATQFPDNNFAIVDYPYEALKNKPSNVRGLTFATNENSYLIGYLAAKQVQKQGGKQIISAVGGQKIPTVTIFIAGYTAGAKAANPNVKVLVDYSQEFVQQAPCKELALDQIAKGSQAVFQVAGGCGLGALSAAADKDVWGIGVDRDQSDLGPHILTSAVKRVDTSVFDTTKAVEDGTFKGGQDQTFDLANDGVALGKVSPEVSQDILDEVDDLKQQIIDGTITVPTQ
ncbi:MAG TPA: BMP family ABC transporter substrate-binding protein [Miltoncostaeaceae bacterium]|nr:BMP family ABC transporter substrate-binding protein [Miltoncostaeaceae bacterium]